MLEQFTKVSYWNCEFWGQVFMIGCSSNINQPVFTDLRTSSNKKADPTFGVNTYLLTGQWREWFYTRLFSRLRSSSCDQTPKSGWPVQVCMHKPLVIHGCMPRIASKQSKFNNEKEDFFFWCCFNNTYVIKKWWLGTRPIHTCNFDETLNRQRSHCNYKNGW